MPAPDEPKSPLGSTARQKLRDPGRRTFLVEAGFAAGAFVVSAGSLSSTVAVAAEPPELGQGKPEVGHVPEDSRPFQFKSEPQRQRKSFYDLTDSEVRILCRAVGHMRNGSKDKPLSVDSPLQWDQWVTAHARHCTETKPGIVDQVHWSWFFLPWHRAYLWFLERRLADIISTTLGEDGSQFALPYWDWIIHKEVPNTKARTLNGTPSPLFGYDLSRENMVNDDALGFDNQALWDGYRKPTVQQPSMDPRNEHALDSKEHIEETVLFMSPQYAQYMLQLDFEDFAGKAVPPHSQIATSDGMGVLEHYPHNNGHDWVGSRLGKNRDMGTLRYAATDPIFFMHHANIDRIWSWYRGVQPDPAKPWGQSNLIWGEQHYTFTDIDGAPVTVTVSDIIKLMTNVTYIEPESATAAKSLLSGASSPPVRNPKEYTMSLAEEAPMLTTKPLTIAILPQPGTRTLLDAMIKERPHPLALLKIVTGPIMYTGKFTIKVFINKNDAIATTSIHDPHYIGRIRALDSDARGNDGGTNITHTFSLLLPPGTSNFYKLVKPGIAFSVTLAAAGPSPKDETFQIPVRNIGVKVVE